LPSIEAKPFLSKDLVNAIPSYKKRSVSYISLIFGWFCFLHFPNFLWSPFLKFFHYYNIGMADLNLFLFK
jgi:hypothetical protein